MQVTIELRLPNKDDFIDQFGKRRIGTLYFVKSSLTGIEKFPNYYNENTDFETFKELYKSHQILVPVRFSDPVEIKLIINKTKNNE